MTGDAKLTQLFADLGPLFDEADISEYPEAKTFHVILGDDLDMFIEHDDERGCLVFSSNLGVPPANMRQDLLPILMVTNNLWAETGGLRFALEKVDGAVILLWDVPAADLNPTELRTAVSGFAERLCYWRSIVAKGIRDMDGDGPDDPVDPAHIIHG